MQEFNLATGSTDGEEEAEGDKKKEIEEEADKDGKPTQKAKFVKEPASLARAKTAYDKATEKDEVAKVKQDVKKDAFKKFSL